MSCVCVGVNVWSCFLHSSGRFIHLPHYIENDLHLDLPAGACLIPRHKITHQSRVAVGQATHRRTSIAMVFSTCATSDIKTSSAMHPSLEHMFLLELSVTRMPTTTSVHQSWRLQREKLKFLDANMLTKSFRMPYVLAWQRSFWKSTISMFVQSAKSTSIASRTQTMIHTTKFPESWALLSRCLALTGCQLLSWFRGSKIGFLLTKRQASELEMASISFTYTVRVCLGPLVCFDMFYGSWDASCRTVQPSRFFLSTVLIWQLLAYQAEWFWSVAPERRSS